MNNRNNKIRKAMLTMALGMMLSLTATSQVFSLDEDNNRAEFEEQNFGSMEVPDINSGTDFGFAPIGSGSLLLVALGGVYLLSKKKNDNH